MSEEENKQSEGCPVCEECSCTGWKVGFYIFVALSVILFIIVLILWFISGNKKDDLKRSINGKIGNVFMKHSDNPEFNEKANRTFILTSSPQPQEEVDYEGVGGELDRLLSSLSE